MLNGTASISDPGATTRPAEYASTSPDAEPRPARCRAQREGGPPGGLVLTRQPGESIMIGEMVEIRVVGLRGGKVRLKVIAPREIPVHRREIFDAIRPEQGPSRPRSAVGAIAQSHRPES